MNVVVALDSFKGSVSSAAAGEAVARGVLAANPGANVTVLPIADGGEGTIEAWASAPNRPGVTRELIAEVGSNCFGVPVPVQYLIESGRDGAAMTAVLECAQTVGLVGAGAINHETPARASTASLGEQILRVLDRGVTKIAIGLGGSATTDGGVGMLLALGARITDQHGRKITAIAGRNPLLDGPSTVELPDLAGQYGPIELIIMTDVNNGLTGPTGAAHRFGPQKGADPSQVLLLEQRMQGWANALNQAGHPVADERGAGAAGGLGAALLALGATVFPGLNYLVAAMGYKRMLQTADLVFTGEGAIDISTLSGKAPLAIAKLAKSGNNAHVVALAGKVTAQGRQIRYVDQVLCIHQPDTPLDRAMDPQVTMTALEQTARGVIEAF